MVERRQRKAKNKGHKEALPPGGEVVPIQEKRPPGFQPGHPKYGGRKLGTPNNRGIKAMREWMDEAAHLFGYDGKGAGGQLGFFIRRLEENPDLFFEVMAKLQPRVLQAANEQRLAVDMNYETAEQAREALAREGIIIDR
jgi:hypothetical protein